VPSAVAGAGTGLACGAASGNPAPGRGPAGCLLDGLPPGRRPRQGLRSRSWETPEGDKRSVVEVEADEVAPSLRWAVAKPQRAARNGEAKPSGNGEFNDDARF
jgi:hypothetical protein